MTDDQSISRLMSRIAPFMDDNGDDSCSTRAHGETNPKVTGGDGTERLLVTDGGLQVRSYEDVSSNDDLIREYSGDRKVYAYRDGDKYVTVLQNHDGTVQQVLTQPVEQRLIFRDDSFWVVPGNWDQKLIIDDPGGDRYAVYTLGVSSTAVLLTVPGNPEEESPDYHVEASGDLRVTYDDACDWEALESRLPEIRDRDSISAAAGEALDDLLDERDAFEREFTALVEKHAEVAVLDPHDASVPTLDGWTVEPWEESFRYDPVLTYTLNIRGDIRDEVAELLSAENIVPDAPTVRVSIDE